VATLFLVRRDIGWQVWVFSWKGDGYACVTCAVLYVWPRLSITSSSRTKFRTADRNSALLEKRCRFFCSWLYSTLNWQMTAKLNVPERNYALVNRDELFVSREQIFGRVASSVEAAATEAFCVIYHRLLKEHRRVASCSKQLLEETYFSRLISCLQVAQAVYNRKVWIWVISCFRKGF